MLTSTGGASPEAWESLTEADLGAAEDDHEEERGEQVHPKVDDDHQGEHVDSVAALLPLHTRHPHRARHQPADLKQDVNWKQDDTECI